MKYVIDNGVNINKTNNNGKTLLIQTYCKLTSYDCKSIIFLVNQGGDLK